MSRSETSPGKPETGAVSGPDTQAGMPHKPGVSRDRSAQRTHASMSCNNACIAIEDISRPVTSGNKGRSHILIAQPLLRLPRPPTSSSPSLRQALTGRCKQEFYKCRDTQNSPRRHLCPPRLCRGSHFETEVFSTAYDEGPDREEHLELRLSARAGKVGLGHFYSRSGSVTP